MARTHGGKIAAIPSLRAFLYPELYPELPTDINLPVADFTSDFVSGSHAPFLIYFTDTSTSIHNIVLWDWDFGDGSQHSTAQDTNHYYASAGTYTVTLTVSNMFGPDSVTKTNYITLEEPQVVNIPVASFSADHRNGDMPLTVHFTDTSTNEPTTWFWNFGDGENSSDKNPEHIYAVAGTYDVYLMASNRAGQSEWSEHAFITVTTLNGINPPVALFCANELTGGAPFTVHFTDQSTNNPDEWLWNFGDDGTSTLRNPDHQYAAVGTYTVTLTATNAAGFDDEMKTDYIHVTENTDPPVAQFTGHFINGDQAPALFQFTDTSTHNPNEWHWTFGDGVEDWNRNPINQYMNPGTYTVTLTATNAFGSDTETKNNFIIVAVNVNAPVAQFSANVLTGNAPLSVQFTDDSTNNPTSWYWNFGDECFDNGKNPLHQYAAAGTYTVTLTAANASGSDTETKTGYIIVATPQGVIAPVAQFSAIPLTGVAPLTVQFTDESTNNPIYWEWDFGDGQISTAQNPLHTYASAGTYTVLFTAINTAGFDYEDKANYITVTPTVTPVAEFSSDYTNGIVPLTVQFTDLSTNDPTEWSWDFGDGAHSTEKNPEHIFAAAGSYEIILVATNAAGFDVEAKFNYITVNPPAPVASFCALPLVAPLATSGHQFTDTSTNAPTSWLWDFGDGQTDFIQHPSHSYSTSGWKTISLTATNVSGSNTIIMENYIYIIP